MKKGTNRWVAIGWRLVRTKGFYLLLSILLIVALYQKGLPDFLQFGSRQSAPARVSLTPDPAMNQMSLWPGGGKRTEVVAPVSEAQAVAFFQRFNKVATAEQKKFGIPASVILAAAYVNSFAGQRDCAEVANNYFALGCSGDWEGEKENSDGRCYRKYNSGWESFRDFNIALATTTWFGKLKKDAGHDWEKWVDGLADHDISDVYAAPDEMKKVIRAYRLFEFDSGK